MKSPFAKSEKLNDALETALRESAPETHFPPGLHDIIIRKVRAAQREQSIEVSAFGRFLHFFQVRWLPVTAVAVIALVGGWITVHHRAEPPAANSQSLPPIASAFSAGQQVVETLPSVAVGPLSDELDKANQDLNRTADFLLATLP